MPGLVRKLLVFAAVDGLVLQPAPPRNHKPTTEQAIKLEYKSNAVSPLLKDRRQEDTAPSTLEVHGIVGLLKVATSSFLVSISRREQVAQIRGKPIYSISEVALIPLSSQSDAEKAIVRARDSQRRHNEAEEEESSDSSDEDRDDVSLTEDHSVTSTPPESEPAPGDGLHKRKTSIAEDVIGRKGLYGRFTQRWFSKGGWTTENRRKEGMSSEEDLSNAPVKERLAALNPAPTESQEHIQKNDIGEADASSDSRNSQLPNEPPPEVEHAVNEPSETPQIPLLPKLLTVTKFLFSSKSFYFSYEYDLSRSIANQPNASSSLALPKSFDPLFFWNKHLATPFIEAGQHGFVIPLIQGFVGQRAFAVDTPESPVAHKISGAASKPEEVIDVQNRAVPDPQAQALSDAGLDIAEEFSKDQHLLTLISRRSVKRAGLRYLRRGIDEEGNVANSVETEQILASTSWDTSGGNIYSFVQYRGSIPLFFSQSPYSLKPIVQMNGSWDQNAAAFRLHFLQLKARYGNVQVDSLVEKQGTEAKAGELFEKHAKALHENGGIDGKGNELGFEWFDFHHACRGMRFENVSQLFDTIGLTLDSFSWTVQQGDQTLQRQSGVLRTNCMDCLDRTNVVQSACGRRLLEQQLKEQGITIDLQTDPRTAWFNSVWADNGDAISRQYAGTAALKGDFTRTRKRNLSGALTDFGLTLTRYYNNIVNDYFAQNVIDFILGRVDESAFVDFEADMKAQDYAVDLSKVRHNAIDTCSGICIEDPNEDLIAGWTLSCPREPNTLRSLPFEECVLLLTQQAVYFCRMDWSTEKVRLFERINLECIDAMARGTYITSTLASREMDEKKNVGFVIRYSNIGGDLVRVNTRSLGGETEEETKKKAKGSAKGEKQAGNSKLLAFKALPPRSSFVDMAGQAQQPPSEIELTKMVCEQIVKVVNAARKGESAITEDKYDLKDSEQSAENMEELSELIQVEEKDIINLTDAKRSTGYLEQLGYSLKKLVWAS